jgi:hypothetical protein
VQELAALKFYMEDVNNHTEEIGLKMDGVEGKITTLTEQMARLEVFFTVDRGHSSEHANKSPENKDGNFTHGYGYPWVLYPYGQGMGTFLYSWVVHIPYPLIHGWGTDIAFHPRVYSYPTYLY